MSKEKLLVSFSGGRTSAYMSYSLKRYFSHKYEMIFVFANTGKEKEQTLEFVRDCSNYFDLNVVWVQAIVHPEMGKGVEAKIVDFNSAARKGEPFRAVIAKYGIPNQNSPHCSRVLKAQTIRAYARSIGWEKKDYLTAIGIRADEPARLNWEKMKYERLLYPLATLKRTIKSDVNKFWGMQPFDLQLKSFEGNCDACWKKSDRKLFTIITEDPSIGDWWEEQEIDFENFIPETHAHNVNAKPPFRFFRGNRTIADLEEEAAFGFEPAIDESKDIDNYLQMALWDNELDSNGGCVESCEAF